MPVEGPISRKLHHAARDLAEQKLTGAVTHVLEQALPSLGPITLSVDDGFVKESVSELLRAVLGEPVALQTPGAQELKAAAHSFVDPTLAPSERRALLQKASGDALTDSVLAVLKDLVAIAPTGAFQKGGAALSKVVGDPEATKEIADKWYAMYLPSAGSVEEVGASLESLRERLKDPAFRAQLHRALDVVRALGRLEAHHLENIAIDVGDGASPEKKAATRRALDSYALTCVDAIADAVVPHDGEAGRAAREMIALGVLHLRATTGSATREDGVRFRALLKNLGQRAHGASPADALESSSRAARQLPHKLDAARDGLLKDLEAAGTMDARAREAITEIAADLSAVVVTAAHLLRFAGAAQNSQIPESERISLLKNAAKDAGPVVVKLLQTFANQAAAESTGVDGVTMKALRELHENVPAMSPAEVREQVEAGLGVKLEEAFTHFDMHPLASASVGQVHRARIVTPNILGFGAEREVVVKVQRPHLDVEFARATRVARLGLQLAGELVRVLQEQGPDGPLKNLPKNMDPQKLMKLVEETVTSFVESFAVETDFDKERNNLKKFRRDMSSHAYVTAPYVFRRWSSRTVLTMEFMKLEKLPSLIQRADVARAQKKLPAPTGPLDRMTESTAVKDVARRALDHLPRAFGILGIEGSPVVKREAGGYVVSVNTAHPMFSLVTLKIEDNGVIRHVKVPPIIKDEAVRQVRDHFLASLLSQAVVHGRVHGDPHKGNWGVLADGQTIVMLDFGKVIDLEKKQLMAPVRLAWNWFRKDASGMADAVLTMTDSKNGDRKAAKASLTAALGDLVKKGTDRAAPEEIVALISATLAQHGLGLSSVYTQGIKAGFSFAGNFGGLAEAGAGELGLGNWMSASRIAAGDALDSATFGVVGGVIAMRKNARTKRLNELL
jgi:predicted unusual protein kinase regulating ubiquinone biosynthesis (AarF/ABC1/UbiB family)